MRLREVLRGRYFWIKGKDGMFGFRFFEVKMIMSYNSFGRIEILGRSGSVIRIWEVCYIMTTEEVF